MSEEDTKTLTIEELYSPPEQADESFFEDDRLIDMVQKERVKRILGYRGKTRMTDIMLLDGIVNTAMQKKKLKQEAESEQQYREFACSIAQQLKEFRQQGHNVLDIQHTHEPSHTLPQPNVDNTEFQLVEGETEKGIYKVPIDEDLIEKITE